MVDTNGVLQARMARVRLTSECYGVSRVYLCTAVARNTVPLRDDRNAIRPWYFSTVVICFKRRRIRLEKRTGILGLSRAGDAGSTTGQEWALATTRPRLFHRCKNGAQRRHAVASSRTTDVDSPAEL